MRCSLEIMHKDYLSIAFRNQEGKREALSLNPLRLQPSSLEAVVITFCDCCSLDSPSL